MTKHARRVGVAPSLVPPEEPEVVCGLGGVAEMYLQHMDPEDHQGTENAAASASEMRPNAELDADTREFTVHALYWVQRLYVQP